MSTATEHNHALNSSTLQHRQNLLPSKVSSKAAVAALRALQTKLLELENEKQRLERSQQQQQQQVKDEIAELQRRYEKKIANKIASNTELSEQLQAAQHKSNELGRKMQKSRDVFDELREKVISTTRASESLAHRLDCVQRESEQLKDELEKARCRERDTLRKKERSDELLMDAQHEANQCLKEHKKRIVAMSHATSSRLSDKESDTQESQDTSYTPYLKHNNLVYKKESSLDAVSEALTEEKEKHRILEQKYIKMEKMLESLKFHSKNSSRKARKELVSSKAGRNTLQCNNVKETQMRNKKHTFTQAYATAANRSAMNSSLSHRSSSSSTSSRHSSRPLRQSTSLSARSRMNLQNNNSAEILLRQTPHSQLSARRANSVMMKTDKLHRSERRKNSNISSRIKAKTKKCNKPIGAKRKSSSLLKRLKSTYSNKEIPFMPGGKTKKGNSFSLTSNVQEYIGALPNTNDYSRMRSRRRSPSCHVKHTQLKNHIKQLQKHIKILTQSSQNLLDNVSVMPKDEAHEQVIDVLAKISEATALLDELQSAQQQALRRQNHNNTSTTPTRSRSKSPSRFPSPSSQRCYDRKLRMMDFLENYKRDVFGINDDDDDEDENTN